MGLREWMLLFLLAVICTQMTEAYLEYKDGEQVPVYVNKVGPYANPHETYHYYNLPICRPDQIVHQSLSLGQVLDGDRMANSAFDIRFMKKSNLHSLCGKKELNKEEVNILVEAIEEDYYAEMIIDDMKVHHFIGRVEEANVFPHDHTIYLYTHYVFQIEYNAHNVISVQLRMNKSSVVELKHDTGSNVEWKYSVEWNETKENIKSRPSGPSSFFISRVARVHWLSILNSLLLVGLLVAVVVLIVFSSVRRDLSRYNSFDGDDDLCLENGWKTVAGDVFRPPSHPILLSAILGAGSQLLALAASVLLIGSMGLMNVHNHGRLNSLCVVLYALTSGIAGFVSSFKYQSLEGKRWIANINITSLVFVVPLSTAWLFNNTVAWMHDSTQALPWTTVLVVLVIWLVIGYPLTVIGGVLGRAARMRKAGSTAPFRTRAIPRELPHGSCTRSTPVQALVAGLVPFCAISVELSYIFSTIWGRDAYTLFYMVAIVFLILIVVVACTSIGVTYLQLNGENYHWWWRSLLAGGSVSIYVFVYGLMFLFHGSSMTGWVQLSEFFTHLGLLCYAAFLSCGTIAHIASSHFVQHIYSSVKSD